MFEVVLLIIAVAAQSAGSVSTVSTHSVTVPAVEPSTTAAAPAFLAPAPSDDQIVAAAPPAFLAPPVEAAVAPAFLAPAPTVSAPAAAPAFLAPAAKPALVAESQTPTGRYTTASEVRPILTATRGSWIAMGDFDGEDVLYVTHLWAWRCGLVEMRIGINGNTPEVWPLPECHLDHPSPGAITDEDGVPYRKFPEGSIAMIEVELTYDDLSTDSAKFNHNGLLLP